MCAHRALRSALRPRRSKGLQRSAPTPVSALNFDPMSDRVEPCLALLTARAPIGPDWAFEVKWDGYRLAIISSVADSSDIQAMEILLRAVAVA